MSTDYNSALDTTHPLIDQSRLQRHITDIPPALFDATNFNAFDHWNTDEDVLQQYRAQMTKVINSIVDTYIVSFNTSTTYYTDINRLFNDSHYIVNDVKTIVDTCELNVDNTSLATLLQQYRVQQSVVNTLEQVEYLTYVPSAVSELIQHDYLLHTTYLIQHTLQILLQTDMHEIDTLSTICTDLLQHRNTLQQQCIERLYKSIYTDYTAAPRTEQCSHIQHSTVAQRGLAGPHSPFTALHTSESPSSTDASQQYSFNALLRAENTSSPMTQQQWQNLLIQCLAYLKALQQFVTYDRRLMQSTVKQLFDQYSDGVLSGHGDNAAGDVLRGKMQALLETHEYVMSVVSKRTQLEDADDGTVPMTLQQCMDVQMRGVMLNGVVMNGSSGPGRMNGALTPRQQPVQNGSSAPPVMQFSFAVNALPSSLKGNQANGTNGNGNR